MHHQNVAFQGYRWGWVGYFRFLAPGAQFPAPGKTPPHPFQTLCYITRPRFEGSEWCPIGTVLMPASFQSGEGARGLHGVWLAGNWTPSRAHGRALGTPYWAGSQYRGKYLCIFSRGTKKVEKSRENHEKVEFFRFFKIDPKVKIWSYGGQFWPKNRFFFENFVFFFFGSGPILGGLPVLGKILMHFQPGGQKSRKKSKNYEKVEFFQFFKIDPDVKIWSYGGQFWPKNWFFVENFVFSPQLGPIGLRLGATQYFIFVCWGTVPLGLPKGIVPQRTSMW